MVLKRKNILVLLFSLLIIISGVVLIIYFGFYQEGREIGAEFSGINNILKLENSFKSKPTIDDGVMLIEKNLFMFKDYDKAIKYGEACIELGVNQTNGGWLVNLWMGKAYLEKGDVISAKYYVNQAIKLDSEGLMKKNNFIETLGLSHVVQKRK